jgi:hypothetical protein
MLLATRLGKCLGALAIIVLSTATVFSIPIPTLDIADLTNSSELVIVSRVVGVTKLKHERKTLAGIEQDCQVVQAKLEVIRSLKGSPNSSTIAVNYLIPLQDSIGYRGVRNNDVIVALLELTNENGVYKFTSPYHPSLPALSLPPAKAGTVVDDVVAEVAQVISSSEADWSARRRAMFVLNHVSSTIVTNALRRAVLDTDRRVNLYASAFLLLRNDVSGLQVATKALLGTQPLRMDDRSTLLAGIDHGLHNAESINTLRELLQSPDADVRAAAASGLGNTGSSQAYSVLVHVLNDASLSVRYSAARALANLSGDGNWQPQDLQTFASEEQKYLEHWRSLVNPED